ncbi:MFS transporter [Methyloligella solikamskensis]|uniref:MFS transporter n=1 Tax=Methyloligella solikamskensis TaxID=1177756 RepID=A0ABW3JBZ3_9HYPH
MDNAQRTSHAPVGFVLFALAIGGFAIGTTEFAAMSLLPFFSEELGLDKPTAGHVISAYALGVVVGAPVIAVLGARIPRRLLLVGLMVTFALGNGLTALAGSYDFMLLARFLSGLPHGAYFGVAALLAAALVGPHKRSQAFARVMLGLTVATIAGVPLANGIGQYFGWRWAFVLVSGLALLTATLLFLFAPRAKEPEGGDPLTELGALARPQVWLTLAIGAIGFGGMFAVYTYLASTVLQVTGEPPTAIPFTLAVFGIGLTLGNLVAGWAADKALMPTAGIVLVWSLIALTIYPFTTGSLWTLCPAVLAIGCGGGLATALQIRLMDVAGQAQTLAAALNHSAFNFANALGPWLAGMALAAGWGLSETGWVGSLLAICGLIFWAWSWALDRRRSPKEEPEPELAPAE